LTISSSTLEVFYGILVWEYWFSFSFYNIFLVCAFIFILFFSYKFCEKNMTCIILILIHNHRSLIRFSP
jgi:hypothetical protein